jgi:hypothetical protein
MSQRGRRPTPSGCKLVAGQYRSIEVSMRHKLITKIKGGVFRGILIAFLTGLFSPLFIEGINFFTELINNSKIALPLLVLPELYLITSLIAFACYFLPCIILGVILEYLPINKHTGILALVLVSGISSYMIWSFVFLAFRLDLYAPLLIFIVVLFHYLYFFAWRRLADKEHTHSAMVS